MVQESCALAACALSSTAASGRPLLALHGRGVVSASPRRPLLGAWPQRHRPAAASQLRASAHSISSLGGRWGWGAEASETPE